MPRAASGLDRPIAALPAASPAAATPLLLLVVADPAEIAPLLAELADMPGGTGFATEVWVTGGPPPAAADRAAALVLSDRFAGRAPPVAVDALARERALPLLGRDALLEERLAQVRLPSWEAEPAWVRSPQALHNRPGALACKRALDLLGAGTALILALPLLLLVALAVRLGSPGPAILRQSRIGRGAVPFPLYKFRTMRTDRCPAAGAGTLYTVENDPRVTRLGRLLRATHLDELPQLVNVLRGDMSLVGPRPELAALAAAYERQIPRYHIRHLVRPGITGHAQVAYRYSASVEEARRKLRFDLYYIKRFSWRLEVSILLRTVASLAARRGR